MRRLVLACFAIGCSSPVEGDVTQGLALEMVDIEGAITIDPTEIEIVGPAGVTKATSFQITGSGAATHIASLQWVDDTGNVFDAVDPLCPAGICPYGVPGILLPKTATVRCIPDATVRSATLQVNSNSGATGSTLVTCRSTASGPGFTVPGIVGRVAAAVGDSVPANLLVTNTGGEPLMVTVALDGAANAAWKVLDCTITPCPLAVGGTVSVPINFEPLEHGDLDTTIEVFAPAALGSQTVMLLGTGIGGKLRVDEPSAPEFVLDFGTIAKNQLVTLPIELSNVGNLALQVTPSNPGAPFAVSTMPLAIDEAQQGLISVNCMAGTAMPQQTETITLTTDAYEANTPSIEVRCAIANTTVQVTNPLDFGELRVGTTDNTIDVVIANPMGNAPVMIDSIELSGAPTELSIDPPPLGMLAGGAEVMATLELDTRADVELEGVTLDIEITEAGDTVTLSRPVTGKVGTAAAVVLPAALDLGSVCVGTQVDGEIAMSNIGTVTLTMQRPVMSSPSFVPLYTNPTDYPDTGAPLPPGDKATVGVMLASSMSGLQEGTLQWDVDVPGATFETKVSVELLMEGTAVSPASLGFGQLAIDEPPSLVQIITLENCGPGPAIITYDRVEASQGSTAAWKLDPPSQQRELLPDETMRVRVAFDPDQPGLHVAELPFAIDGGQRIVRLDGEATGVLPEETSFYACGCSGSSDPTRGWPILLAIPFALRRRRR